MTDHPCLCDKCLTARDSELRRAVVAERSRCVTIVDGCAVHGDKPMSAESRAAISEVIATAHKKLTQ